MPERIFTKSDVLAAIEAAVERTPDAMNPCIHDDTIPYSGCAYTGKDGNHCIAGQVLADLGFEVPALDDERNTHGILDLLHDTGAAKRFKPDARDVLADAQWFFDAGAGKGETWKDSFATLLHEVQA